MGVRRRWDFGFGWQAREDKGRSAGVPLLLAQFGPASLVVWCLDSRMVQLLFLVPHLYPSLRQSTNPSIHPSISHQLINLLARFRSSYHDDQSIDVACIVDDAIAGVVGAVAVAVAVAAVHAVVENGTGTLWWRHHPRRLTAVCCAFCGVARRCMDAGSLPVEHWCEHSRAMSSTL